MAEQWLTIVEYARTFQVSDMTVRRRIKTGKLHAILKEGKYYIPIPDAVGSSAAPSGAGRSPHEAQPNAAGGQRRSPGEMSVIKGHPQAHKTFPHMQPQPVQARDVGGRASYADMRPPVTMHEASPPPRQEYLPDDGDFGGDVSIPTSLRRPFGGQESSLVDTRALLAYCEASLRKVAENERRTVEKFKSKLEALEATLATKDMEIKALRQQVEDLQLLVKILERKKQS